MGHSLQNTVWSRHFPSQFVLFSEELYDVFKSPDGVIQPLVSSQPNYAPFKSNYSDLIEFVVQGSLQERDKFTFLLSCNPYIFPHFLLGVVHKLHLQEEVGRWFKNVHFLSVFIPQKMSMEGGRWSKKAIILSTQFENNPSMCYGSPSAMPIPQNDARILDDLSLNIGTNSEGLLSHCVMLFGGKTCAAFLWHEIMQHVQCSMNKCVISR